MPPALIAPSWNSSPTGTIRAPAWSAVACSLSRSAVSTCPASSRRMTSRGPTWTGLTVAPLGVLPRNLARL